MSLPVDYQPTALIIERELTASEYQELLATLGGIARGHQWWVGDAIVNGESMFPDEVWQYVDQLALEIKTAQNYAYVAANVARSRRREKLTWSHHAEVARLGEKAQREVLERAEAEEWTVRQIRDHVALTFPQSGREPAVAPAGQHDDIDTQRRLEEIDLRWQDVVPDRWGHLPRLTEQHRADVRWLLELAKRATRGS